MVKTYLREKEAYKPKWEKLEEKGQYLLRARSKLHEARLIFHVGLG
jgi:hypothetical protein